jgi:hypothetical protein
MTVADILI